MTQDQHVITTCGRLEEATDVISGQDVKSVYDYTVVNVYVISSSSFQEKLTWMNVVTLWPNFEVNEQKSLTPFTAGNEAPESIFFKLSTFFENCLTIIEKSRLEHDRISAYYRSLRPTGSSGWRHSRSKCEVHLGLYRGRFLSCKLK